ncbi:TonB-dependent receptor domain-containing protein [Pedobacter sp. Hv1]|uniref:TonB-dependent receptor n=1 Tax=Pedobacter sp. Hv1 TaxID=1740090 RepID=UPI0006D8CA6C|nr:TonB-dependent receptor [Pedobacter sp. Hv1]KQB98848.1 collagen-binding protein [Pedobacter sp. Hv1]
MIFAPFKLTLLALLLFCLNVSAQQLYHVSGNIRTTKTAIAVNDANITIVELKQSIIADSLGFYNLKLKAGSYTFSISAVGMKTLDKVVKVTADQTIDFNLEENPNHLNEIVVSTDQQKRDVANTEIGIERLNMQTVKKLPSMFGEHDIFKAIQLLPGINSAGEAGNGLYVRGGGSDQNLILMDEVPIYNASHLMGFFSTFNSDAVKDITVYKSGMPAQYGGYLSSVLDVKMNQGNVSKLTAAGDIGLVSSKLTLQGPIQKEKSSFLISGRRTYIDALLKFSPDKSISKNALYFYDLNAKLDFQLNPNNKLIIAAYSGSDKLGLSDVFNVSWGNTVASMQLKHRFSDRFTSTTTGSFNNYKNNIELNTTTNHLGFNTQIRDLSLKQDFLWLLNAKNSIKFGFKSVYHTVTPGQLDITGTSNYNPVDYQQKYASENAIYAANNIQATDNLNISLGLRLSGFSILGSGNSLTVDEEGNITDVKNFQKGQVVKTYLNLEPRLAFSYLLNPQSSIKGSYERNVQNMHMISNSTSSRPTDKWMPSSNMIKPEIADQISLGYFRNLSSSLDLTVESYYKVMQNQIDYRDGADLFNADAIETQLLYGKGRAYGLEISLKKKAGAFTGWISYTLAKSERQINGINDDNWYNVRQDRTHDVSIVGVYDISKKLSLSAVWVYYTGDAITAPTGKYKLDGQSFYYYSNRNADRMPNYHRLDISATLQLKKKKTFSSELNLSLYNAYGRKNAYSITFRESEQDSSKTEAVKTSLFQFLPSVSYCFKFI